MGLTIITHRLTNRLHSANLSSYSLTHWAQRMDFSLSEEQRLLQESVVKFIQNDYLFEHRTKLIESDLGFSRDNWQLFAEQGWLAMFFSEADGGFDADMSYLMVMMEEFGKGLVVEPYVASIVLAGGLLRQLGNEQQKSAYVSGLIDGSKQAAFAYAEPQARFNLADLVTTASKQGGGWVLNGYKAVVMNGPAADFLIVSARTSGNQRDQEGVSLFLVDTGADGLSTRDYPTIDGMRASEVTLDNVQVSSNALLGAEGSASPAIETTIDEGILAIGAEAVGAMEMLYKATVEYCQTRVQFGQPIGRFQVLQHRMVDMFIEHEQAKSLMYMACIRLAEGGNAGSKAISAFKTQIGKSGRFVGQSAVQLHGGMGMTEELNVGHYFKRLTAIENLFGNADYHLKRFGSL